MGTQKTSGVPRIEVSFDPFEIYEDMVIDARQSSQLDPSSLIQTANQTALETSKKSDQRRFNDKKISSAPKRSFSKMIGITKYFVLVIISAAGILALAKVQPWTYFVQPDLAYVYFEVRALDSAGRPIAGAIVKNGNKHVGTTDSFGEWRRYMQVPLGGVVPITLLKSVNNKTLLVTKNFAVPPFKPEKSEVELKSSVQLVPSDVVNPNDSKLPVVSAGQNALAGSDKDTRNNQFGRDDRYLIESSAQTFKSDHESIWFEVMGHDTGVLSEEIVPALAGKAKELGLRVEREASWHVKISNLIDKPSRIARDGGGLIRVVSHDRTDGKEESIEFLRNYQSDSKTTASGILFVLTNQISKNVLMIQHGKRWAAVLPTKGAKVWKLSANSSVMAGEKLLLLGQEAYSNEGLQGFYLKNSEVSPCFNQAQTCLATTRNHNSAPPNPMWQKLRLKIPNLTHESDAVFVSGYLARQLSDGVFEYWGQDRLKANVTILRDGKIQYRGGVTGRAKGMAMFGEANLSRR